jgi:hypothetical protein
MYRTRAQAPANYKHYGKKATEQQKNERADNLLAHPVDSQSRHRVPVLTTPTTWLVRDDRIHGYLQVQACFAKRKYGVMKPVFRAQRTMHCSRQLGHPTLQIDRLGTKGTN